jgi:hypothetical protein
MSIGNVNYPNQINGFLGRGKKLVILGSLNPLSKAPAPVLDVTLFPTFNTSAKLPQVNVVLEPNTASVSQSLTWAHNGVVDTQDTYGGPQVVKVTTLKDGIRSDVMYLPNL